ncbi:MAG: CHAT domain-containing tetratricopeptide repeat protein [Chloroflexota bacterium]
MTEPLSDGEKPEEELLNQCIDRLVGIMLVYIQDDMPLPEEAAALVKSQLTASSEVAGYCAIYLGLVYDSTQDWSQALWAYSRAAEMLSKVDDAQSQWMGLFSQGKTLILQRRFEEALQSLEQALHYTEDDETWDYPSLQRLARAVNYNAIAITIAHQLNLDDQKIKVEQGKRCILIQLETKRSEARNFNKAFAKMDEALSIVRQMAAEYKSVSTTVDQVLADVVGLDPKNIDAVVEEAQQFGIPSNLEQLGIPSNLGQFGVPSDVIRGLENLRSTQIPLPNNIGLPTDYSADALRDYGLNLVIDDLAYGLAEILEPIFLASIGQMHYEQRDFTVASIFLEEAERLLDEPIAHQNNPLSGVLNVIVYFGQGVTQNNLGMLAYAQGEYDSSIQRFEQAIDLLWHKSGNTLAAISIYVTLGTIVDELGHPEQSLAYYEEAIRLLETVRQVVNSGARNLNSSAGSSSLESIALQGPLADHVALYHLAACHYMDAGRYQEAFEMAERGRARLFLDMIATNTSHLPLETATLLQEIQEIFNHLQRLELELKQLPIVGCGINQESLIRAKRRLEGAYASKVAQLNAQEQNAELVELVPKSMSTLDFSAEAKKRIKQIQTDIAGTETTLVEYYVVENRLLAWVIEEDKFAAETLDLPRTEVVSKVEFLRNLIADKDFTKEDGQELYQRLITPLKPHIHHENLIIVPHNALHYLPFAALWDAENEQYLLEQYAISYAPSASVLKHVLENRNPDEGRFLLMGNPDGSLSAAEREVTELASLVGATPYLNDMATEDQLYRQGSNFDVIHLAAHGEYSVADPLVSYIELAPGQEMDGRLEVREVFGLDLSNTNLVVLSACETAIGENSLGDEILGLTRSFLYAGTPAIVTTLWRISDEASSTLMAEFYRNLYQEKMTTAQALRSAQVHVMQQQQWSSPYYWAAFNLTGDYQ